MNSAEWFDKVKANAVALRAIVEKYHPASKVSVAVGPLQVEMPARAMQLSTPVTARAAQDACNVICNDIEQNFEGKPVERYDEALRLGAASVILDLLNDAWFGLPESMASRSITGFFVLCDLCEGWEDEDLQ